MIANKAVAVGDLTCLELLLEAGAKERSAVGDGGDIDFQRDDSDAVDPEIVWRRRVQSGR